MPWKRVEAAAAKYGIDTRDILVELGERRMVGGQEAMIVDVTLDLVKRRSLDEVPVMKESLLVPRTRPSRLRG